MKTTRIALWSGPRNVSTALMYSFANRPDTQVLDEPLFGYFLKHTGAERPSREEALATMETDVQKVMAHIMDQDSRPLLFVKNMACHIEGLPMATLDSFENVILIRRPDAVLASYTKNIKEPTLLDLGYKHQYEIIQYLKGENKNCIVIDSEDILKDPEAILTRLCERLNIAFSSQMLSWDKGPRPEDGVWAKYWYKNVHESTGFAPYSKKEYDVPEQFEELYQESHAYYEKIKEYSIK